MTRLESIPGDTIFDRKESEDLFFSFRKGEVPNNKLRPVGLDVNCTTMCRRDDPILEIATVSCRPI